MHVLRFLKQNVVVCFTLLLAVGAGTSYAFGNSRAHHSQSTAKTAKAPDGVKKPLWAYVDTNTVTHASPSTTVTIVKLGLGDYKLYFPGANLADCARVANLTHIRGFATVTGYDSTNSETHAVRVLTSGATGQPVDADFVVVVFCGTTSGQPTPDQVK